MRIKRAVVSITGSFGLSIPVDYWIPVYRINPVTDVKNIVRRVEIKYHRRTSNRRMRDFSGQ